MTRKAALIACSEGPWISTDAPGCCWKLQVKGEEGVVIELSTSPLPSGEPKKFRVTGPGDHMVPVDKWTSVRVAEGNPNTTYCTLVAERVKCPTEH